MKKAFWIIFGGFEFLFSIFILFGAIFGERDIVAKIIFIFAAIFICPILYIFAKKVLSEKRYMIARIAGFVVGFVLVVISIALFSDRSIDERMVLDKGLICVQNKYSKYDEISVNDYEIFDVEEKDGKKIVKLEMNITAKKDGKEEKKKESFYVGYNKETAEYTFENYEYTGSY